MRPRQFIIDIPYNVLLLADRIIDEENGDAFLSCSGASAAFTPRQPRRAALIAAMSIFVRPHSRFVSSPPGLGQHTRRDLPRHAPLVFAPAAPAFLAAIACRRILGR
jgi:hypothetical protein